MFNFTTSSAIRELEKKREQVLADIEATAAVANACMNTKVFVDYRDKCSQLESKAMDLLVKMTRQFEQDNTLAMDKYAIKVMTLMTKIDVLRTIIKSIESDAKRGELNG